MTISKMYGTAVKQENLNHAVSRKHVKENSEPSESKPLAVSLFHT